MKALTVAVARAATYRFWQKVPIRERGCWRWASALNSDGYGEFRIGGKNFKAHRVAWTLQYGLIPNGMHVLHKCDVPSCCRPEHLFLGTHAENMRDMAKKGRAPGASQPGELHPGAKLTSAEVAEIRTRYVRGRVRLVDLASEYGVCFQSISNIVNRISWND